MRHYLRPPRKKGYARRRAAWNVPENKFVLFCPRRLVKKNGVIYPALALASMKELDRERFLVLHAGEGGERAEMERIIRERQLADHVRLLGGQDPEAVRELYRLADAVLVPSVHSENVEEATSLSALEAMASGRPLIAGRVGGLAEMVRDGETGLLVPAADPEALAAAILRLADEPGLGACLAIAAREYVVANHSHLQAAAAYVEVYRRAARAIAVQAGPTEAPSTGVDERLGVAVGRSAGVGDPAAGSPVSTQPDAAPPPPWASVSVLGFPLDVVTLEQAARWVIAKAVSNAESPKERTALAVSFNPELVMRAQKDPAVAEALWEADLCYPDGVGAAWAAGRQGANQIKDLLAEESSEEAADSVRPRARRHMRRIPPERVAGIELAERVLELAAQQGLSVYFLGAADGVAEEAARRMARRLPGLEVAGVHHGYFTTSDEDVVVRAIRASGARILLVAMGAPRQELFLLRHRDRLGVSVGLGVGGSFDVWAGRVKRAPAWTQRAKIEWLYRLATDPRRIRRQAALPRFAVQVVKWAPEDYGPPRRGRSRHVEAFRATVRDGLQGPVRAEEVDEGPGSKDGGG